MTIVPTAEESKVLEMIDQPEPDVIEGSTALEAQTRGEIDIQIATARKYPRSVRSFLMRTKELVGVDEDTAASCFYRLPRGGKILEGPSIRLAEIVASTWGHMRVEARIVEQDARFIKVRAVAWDLESNYAAAQEVTRRITDKGGKTYSDDMIAVTANAAMSIGLRNAINRVVPRTYTNAFVFLAKQVAVGDIATLSQRRGQSLDYFAKLGVPGDRVFKTLGVAGIEEINLDHLATLKGLATAIKEGTATVDDAFPEPAAEVATTRGAAGLAERLAAGKPETTGTPAPATPAPVAETPKTPDPTPKTRKNAKPAPESDPDGFVASLGLPE